MKVHIRDISDIKFVSIALSLERSCCCVSSSFSSSSLFSLCQSITVLICRGFIKAMRAVHQYSFGKTLASIIGTIIAMLLILFLAILLLSLFQQVYVFGYSVYTEIMYRIRG